MLIVLDNVEFIEEEETKFVKLINDITQHPVSIMFTSMESYKGIDHFKFKRVDKLSTKNAINLLIDKIPNEQN